MPDKADQRQMFYDNFADKFDNHMNMYDTNKRLKIIFDLLLKEDLKDKLLLDAGCGTGWFSKKACELGAQVTSLDVGFRLLAEVEKKCHSKLVEGDVCKLDFAPESFDFIISTEVIEHTVDPLEAISEMYRVLRPGGVLFLTVPNRVWHFSITLAHLLNLRAYEGYENWVGWYQLKKWLSGLGFTIEEMKGFHVFPFVSKPLYPIIDFFDQHQRLAPLMLNIAVRARKA